MFLLVHKGLVDGVMFGGAKLVALLTQLQRVNHGLEHDGGINIHTIVMPIDCTQRLLHTLVFL